MNYAKRRRCKGQTPQDVHKQPQTQIISDHVSFFLYHVTPQVIIQIFFLFFFFERPCSCVIVGFQYCISSYRKKTYLYCFRVTRQFQLTPSVASNRKHCRVVCKYKLFDTNYSLILTIIVPFFIITPQSFLSQTNENNNPRLPIISAIFDLLM